MYRLAIAFFVSLVTAAPCPLFGQSIDFGSGGAAGFAAAVAVVGDEIFIGKSGVNSVYPGRGAVYVYQRDPSIWSSMRKRRPIREPSRAS